MEDKLWHKLFRENKLNEAKAIYYTPDELISSWKSPKGLVYKGKKYNVIREKPYTKMLSQWEGAWRLEPQGHDGKVVYLYPVIANINGYKQIRISDVDNKTVDKWTGKRL